MVRKKKNEEEAEGKTLIGNMPTLVLFGEVYYMVIFPVCFLFWVFFCVHKFWIPFTIFTILIYWMWFSRQYMSLSYTNVIDTLISIAKSNDNVKGGK